MFLTLLNSIFIVATVMGLGFYFQRKNIFDDNTRKKLTDVLFNYTMPCTFFMSMQLEFDNSLLKNAFLILLASFIMHLLFILIGYLTCFILKIPKNDKGVVIFAITFANLSFIGFPLLRTVFAGVSQDPIFYAAIYTVPFNLLAFTFGVNILNTSSNKVKFNIKSFIVPVNIALVSGFICFSFGLLVPKVIGDTLNIIGQISIPLSLLLTGAILSKSNLGKLTFDPTLIGVNFVRLVVCPIIFYFVLKPIGLDNYTFSIAVILSMLPTGAYTAILSEKYGGNYELASKIVFTSTLSSLFSIVVLATFLI